MSAGRDDKGQLLIFLKGKDYKDVPKEIRHEFEKVEKKEKPKSKK